MNFGPFPKGEESIHLQGQGGGGEQERIASGGGENWVREENGLLLEEKEFGVKKRPRQGLWADEKIAKKNGRDPS